MMPEEVQEASEEAVAEVKVEAPLVCHIYCTFSVVGKLQKTKTRNKNYVLLKVIRAKLTNTLEVEKLTK